MQQNTSPVAVAVNTEAPKVPVVRAGDASAPSRALCVTIGRVRLGSYRLPRVGRHVDRQCRAGGMN